MSSLKFTRYYQATDSTCGPAVLRMLLDFYQISTTEEQVVKATKVGLVEIESNGTRLDQFSEVVTSLAPKYQLWYKEDATVEDIDRLIHEYKIPVGIDWQGLFWENLLEESRLSTEVYHGHYSVVVDIDQKKDTITIADPYHTFTGKDREFPIDWFKSRWWDIADTYGTEVEGEIPYYVSRMIFIVAPKTKKFPAKLGMKLVPKNYFAQKIEKARKTLHVHPPFEPGKKKLSMLKFLVSLNRRIMERVG